MTEQERFELAISKHDVFGLVFTKSNSGEYTSTFTHYAFLGFKAGRADAYQEAQEYYMTSWAKDETRIEK